MLAMLGSALIAWLRLRLNPDVVLAGGALTTTAPPRYESPSWVFRSETARRLPRDGDRQPGSLD